MSDSASNTIETTTANRAGTGRAGLGMLLAALMLLPGLLSVTASEMSSFRSVPTQYIAALGDPQASSGYGANTWGLWRKDPGPRGVRLSHFERKLVKTGGVAPANWTFDQDDWWLDENGLIMERPEFPVPPGRYIVTGDRAAMAVLTIYPMDDFGRQRWALGNGAKLYDVTHLPCRSSRYTPASEGVKCSPAELSITNFPIKHDVAMPDFENCRKQDYAVLFIVAEAEDNDKFRSAAYTQ